MELVVIAAVAENGVIGVDGEMPWHIPEDLAHFKRATTEHPVIMGRVTYESIIDDLGGPLPDRPNIVLSRSGVDAPEGVAVVESAEAALDAAAERIEAADSASDEPVFVIGGATVYEQFLPDADRLLLTEIRERYDGDTYFPDWDRRLWTELARDERDGFAFVEYATEGDVAPAFVE
ncbi:dihydrofolate reductase [Natronoarchaeum philippinense]|uniref:dihydrofolate reductase n=1 Tax=Natronoarchaeum philippinense TaxID=558529 RepID=A0A285N702_NATPI|nr:dihydrofolate reductase [Natronoarchaeum philippinense]SNZ04703.1 dihydrofolate reductase [Natronoarchaeum philippinense]